VTSNPSDVDPDLLRVAVAAKGPIGSLGGAWMTDPAEEAATEALGLHDWQLYFLGRHGVLSDVDPDVVAAAAYAFPAARVRSEWEAARRVMTPAEAVQHYVALCHSWGRTRMSGFEGSVRLIDLSQRIVDAVDLPGLPLFAGWRVLPQPADDPARLVHVFQLLREHRGACHGVALVALQMNPLIAILTNEGGAANAAEYGWQPPYPEVTDADRERLQRVERLTDELVAVPYGVLSAAERVEFLELLEAAYSHAFA